VRAAYHAPEWPWTHGCCGVIHNNPDSIRHVLFGVNELKNRSNNKRRS